MDIRNVVVAKIKKKIRKLPTAHTAYSTHHYLFDGLKPLELDWIGLDN